VELMLGAPDVSVISRPPTQADVLAEYRRSCAARAAPGDLIDESGAIGVRRGPAAVLWLHAGIDASRVTELIANAPELTEIYVEAAAGRVIGHVVARGWRIEEVHRQQVVSGPIADPAPVERYKIEEAAPAQMPAIRAVIGAAFNLPAHILNDCYPDTFFTVAAPVRVLVARDAAGRVVGTVAGRRQWRSAMVFGLAVEQAHRRCGLGRTLAATIVHAMLTDGADFVHGLVSADGDPLCVLRGAHEVGRWTRLTRPEVVIAPA
jgi:hypothetical protein